MIWYIVTELRRDDGDRGGRPDPPDDWYIGLTFLLGVLVGAGIVSLALICGGLSWSNW